MGIKDQKTYKLLAEEIDKCRELETNLLIITVPGTGMGRMMHEYGEDRQKVGVMEIGPETGMLGAYNLLNQDWKEVTALEVVEKWFEKAEHDQKIAVSLNYPGYLNREEIKSSFWLNHTYRKYYFGVRDKEDTALMAKEIRPEIGEKEIEEIYRLSGGIAQLIKYLAINGKGNSDEVETILKPVAEAVEGVDEMVLENLGLRVKGEWVSELLKEVVGGEKQLGISINFDLSFEEDGKKSREILSAGERLILEKMIANGGKITKEEVSDIKWGEGKYEEFSDQAINKTMRRIDAKLAVYEIETIAKVGFMLKRK